LTQFINCSLMIRDETDENEEKVDIAKKTGEETAR
jgi:hypothetical protein